MEMNNVETLVVCDTGPVLHLHELENLDLLNSMFKVFGL